MHSRNWMRLISTTAVALTLIVCYRFMCQLEMHFFRADFFSGYVLGSVCVLLFGLSIRKRLLPLPLGRVAVWQQMHHYLGLFSLGMFCLHVSWPIHGWFEWCLTLTFLTIAISGVLGWYLNWSTPRKLNSIPNEVPLERFKSVAGKIAAQAYAIAVKAAGRAENLSLAELYQQRLLHFFQRPRSLAYVLVPTGAHRRRTLAELNELDRYLAEDGRTDRREMSELVKQKDDLDFQTALQMRLRWWVIGHVSLTWLFIILAVVHVLLVHQFAGG